MDMRVTESILEETRQIQNRLKLKMDIDDEIQKLESQARIIGVKIAARKEMLSRLSRRA